MSPHKANPHMAGQLECASVVWKVGEDGSLSQKSKGSPVLPPFHLSLALLLNLGIPRREHESFCTLQCYPFDLSLGFRSLSMGEMTTAGELGTHISRGYHPQ